MNEIVHWRRRLVTENAILAKKSRIQIEQQMSLKVTAYQLGENRRGLE